MTTVFADEYGYSANDATAALQAAIDDPNADTIVVRNTGNPWLISEQIQLKSNKEIVFEEGSVVQAKPGSFLANDKAMIVGRNVENVKLIGEGSGENKATLKMNKEEYNSSQFGHIVSLLGVDGYEVSGLKLTGAGGDGLHLAAGSYEKPDPNTLPYAANGLVKNITSDNNRRQGISIDSAKNLVVRDSTFTNTSGTKPSAGISLEPTWDFESLENIKIENVEISGNEGRAIQMLVGNIDSKSAPVSVDFDNITLTDSNVNTIFISGKYLAGGSDFGSEFKGEPDQSSPNGDINGTVNFNNVNISNADRISSGNAESNPEVYVFLEGISGNQDDPNNLAVNFSNLNINDPLDIPVGTTPIFIQGLGGDNNPQEIGNLSFNDVTIQGNYTYDVVRADLLRADGNLNNVSGDITVFDTNDEGRIFVIDNPEQAKNFDLNVVEGNGQAPTSNVIQPSAEPVAETVEPAAVAVEGGEVIPEPVEPAVADLEGGEVTAEPIEPAVADLEGGEVTAEPIEPAVAVEGGEATAEPVEPAVEIAENASSTDVTETDPQSADLVTENVPATPATLGEGGESDNSTNVREETEADSSFDSASATDLDRSLTSEPASLTEPEGAIQIQNPNFTDSLTGWNPTGGDISVVERSPGDRWARIDSPVGGVSQDVTDRIVAGEDYQISATTKLSESGTRGYIGARFVNTNGELLDLEYTQVTSNGTEKTQTNFTAPEEFARADIFAFKNDGSGSLFVDDFSITE